MSWGFPLLLTVIAFIIAHRFDGHKNLPQASNLATASVESFFNILQGVVVYIIALVISLIGWLIWSLIT